MGIIPERKQGMNAVHMLFRGVLLHGPLKDSSWEGVSMSIVRDASPYKGCFLDVVPGSWDAAAASRFCFGRPDRAPFLYMWGCMFREVEQVCENHSSPIAGDIILEGLTSGRFCEVALVESRGGC